jgi:subtilisin-like proprotein convertase family protein/peroxiredoxin
MTLILGTVFAGTAQAAPTNVKATFSSNTQVAIPDYSPPVDGQPGSTASPVEVSGIVGNITKVTVSFHITHASTNELDIAVIGPAGANVSFAYLFTPLSSNGTSFGTSCADADRTTFDDAASTEITEGTSPFVGTFRPQADRNSPLSVFNNNALGADGTWYLDIIDTVAGNSGTIECWSLFIETDSDQDLRFDAGSMAMNDKVEASGGPGVGLSPITASGLADAVSGLSVTVWVSHTNVTDLDLILVSPDGTEVTLAGRVGGSGDNFGKSCSKGTTFSDSAKSVIVSGTAPFVGTFRPTESLTSLTGTSANGVWRLKVADSVEGVTGQINCWSLSVESNTAAPTPTGIVVTPRLTAPQPLPGTYNYPYFTIKNNTTESISNVTLTSTLPTSLSDVRADPENLPGCDVVGQLLTCHWASIPPGDPTIGGALARVGDPKKGKICLSASVTANEISGITANACFNTLEYPNGDSGTGYEIGDVAHDIALVDQDGNPASLSEHAGKYVLLQFTAVWCAPSNIEVPQDRDEIAALNDANAMGVEVVYLTVLVDGPSPGVPSTLQNAINWANKYDLTTPVLWTGGDTTRSAQQQHMTYDVYADQPGAVVPTSIFIRPDGTIFDVRIGLEEVGGTTTRFLNDLP